MKRTSRYEQIAEMILQEIRNGKFKLGERVYSRTEIVRKFHVSPVTASRVQNALAETGRIRIVRGGGIYILPRKYSCLEHKLCQRKNWKLKKIVYLKVNFSKQRSVHYQLDYIDAVKKAAEKAGIEYCEYPISSSAVSEDLHSYFEIEENTGYLAVNSGTISALYGAAALLNSSVRSVYVDGVITGSHSILSDSFDGMRQMVEELIRQKCRRFIYAENCELNADGVGVAERYRGALFHTRSHGIKLELIDSGSYDDLLSEVRKKDCKTAVMFPQDTPAGIFLRMLKKEKISHVTVSGFDHFSFLRNPPDIITVGPVFDIWAEETIRLLSRFPQLPCRVRFLPMKLHVPVK